MESWNQNLFHIGLERENVNVITTQGCLEPGKDTISNLKIEAYSELIYLFSLILNLENYVTFPWTTRSFGWTVTGRNHTETFKI